MDDQRKTKDQLIAELVALREKLAQSERTVAERHQAEDQVRFQANLLNAVEQAVIVTRLDGEIIFWNPFAERLYGWLAADAIGRNIMDVNVPQVSQVQATDIMEQLSAGKTWSGEFTVLRRDGTTFPAAVTDTPVMDAQGNLTAIIGISRDITERKRYEVELQQNQQFIELIADTIPNQLYVFDLVAGHNIYINDKVEAFNGMTLEALQAKGQTHFYETIHPDDLVNLGQFNIQWGQAEDAQVFEKEYRLRNAEGEYRWIHSYERVLKRNAEGVPVQIVGSALDVTERKRSEEKFGALADLAPAGVYTTDAAGGCTYANPRWLEMAGLRLEQALGDGWIRAIHPDDFKSIQTAWYASVRNLDSWSLEYRFKTPAGKVTWVRGVADPIFDDNYTLEGYIGVNLDITERKTAEENAKKATMLLEDIGRIAKIGGWQLELPSMKPYFSAETYKIYEIPPGEAPELADGINFYTPEARPVITKALEDAIERNIPYDLELPFITAKGRHIWVRTQGRVHVEGGRAVRLYGNIQDITERKQVEAELQATKDFYESIIEGVQDGVWVSDKNDVIFYANKGMSDIAGIPVETIVGNHVLEDFGHETIWEFGNYYQKAKQDLAPTWYETKVVTPAGRESYQNGWLIPRIREGQYDGMICTIRDITGRRHTEAALSSAKDFYLGIIEGVQDGIWVTNETDVIYYANKAMCQISAMMLENIVGHNVLTDFPVENIEEFAADFNRAKAKLEPVWYEHKNINADGMETFNNGWLIPRLRDGNYAGMICTVRDITARKRVEAMLENEKKRFIALLEAFPGFIYLQTPKHRITYANKYFVEHFGDPQQRSCHEILWGRDEPCKPCRTFKVFETHELEEWEWTQSPDGRDYLVYDYPFTDIDGSELVLEIGVDITERKQAEALLKQSEENLNRAQRVAHLGSWTWQIASNQLEWSDEMFRIFGIDKDAFSGDLTDVVQTVIHPDDRAAVEQSNTSVAQESKPVPLEYRIIRPDGAVRTVWAEAGQLSLDAVGNPATLTGIVQDITERKQAEQALRDSEALYHSVVAALSEGLVVQNSDTDEVIFANDSAAQILGLTTDQLMGKSSYDPRWQALHEDGTPFRPDEHPSMISGHTGQLVDNTLMNIRIGDEKRAFISINSRPIRDENDQVARVVTSFTDITDRKRAEDQLKRALADKETLLLELYHRTKNNMQTIMGLINLQASQVENEQALDILRETENRVRSMALVHQKLYQSQNLSSIDLGDYIKELTILLMENYRITQDRIALVFDLTSIPVLIDTAIPCGLILNELVSNVFKHAFPNDEVGVLRITLTQLHDTTIEIEVADNGVGFPEGLDSRESNSVGMKTVYGIAEYQLQGKLHCETGDGVTWRLRFFDTLYQPRV